MRLAHRARHAAQAEVALVRRVVNQIVIIYYHLKLARFDGSEEAGSDGESYRHFEWKGTEHCYRGLLMAVTGTSTVTHRGTTARRTI